MYALNPTAANTSVTRARICSESSCPATRSGNATFSNTLRSRSNLKS